MNKISIMKPLLVSAINKYYEAVACLCHALAGCDR